MYDHKRYLELLNALERARRGYYRLLWPENSKRQNITHITDLDELKIAGQDFFAAKRALMAYLWEYAHEDTKPSAAVPPVPVKPYVEPPVEPSEEIKSTQTDFRIKEDSLS